MILDRLRAQPELMDALGVKFGTTTLTEHSLYIKSEPADVTNYVNFQHDEVDGSALLLVRCMRWLYERTALCALVSKKLDIQPCWSCGSSPDYTDIDKKHAPTMVEAAVRAVLAVQEGKIVDGGERN